MSPTAGFEITFNVAYLIVVWSFVVVMTRNLGRLSDAQRNVASRVRLAFLLLALGDTGHVGARAFTIGSGNLEAHANWFGLDISLVGGIRGVVERKIRLYAQFLGRYVERSAERRKRRGKTRFGWTIAMARAGAVDCRSRKAWCFAACFADGMPRSHSLDEALPMAKRPVSNGFSTGNLLFCWAWFEFCCSATIRRCPCLPGPGLEAAPEYLRATVVARGKTL